MHACRACAARGSAGHGLRTAPHDQAGRLPLGASGCGCKRSARGAQTHLLHSRVLNTCCWGSPLPPLLLSEGGPDGGGAGGGMEDGS